MAWSRIRRMTSQREGPESSKCGIRRMPTHLPPVASLLELVSSKKSTILSRDFGAIFCEDWINRKKTPAALVVQEQRGNHPHSEAFPRPLWK